MPDIRIDPRTGVITATPYGPTGMTSPVRCHNCGGTYDLGTVDVTARYQDCTVWTAPCCGLTGIDDRPEGWGGRRRYTELAARPDTAGPQVG